MELGKSATQLPDLLDEQALAELIKDRFGDRLDGGIGQRAVWKLDGNRATVASIWGGLLLDWIDGEGLKLSFPRNVPQMTAVLGRVRFMQRYGMKPG